MRKFSDYVEAMDQRGNLEVDRDDFNAAKRTNDGRAVCKFQSA